MISLGELAKRTGLPDSTVSYYVKHYGEFLVQRYREGKRHPLYEEQAVEIVEIINRLTRERKSREEIRSFLTQTYDPVFDVQPLPPTIEDRKTNEPKSTTDQQGLVVTRLVAIQETVRATLRMLEDQDVIIARQEREVERLKREVADLDTRNRELEEENNRLKNKGETSEE